MYSINEMYCVNKNIIYLDIQQKSPCQFCIVWYMIIITDFIDVAGGGEANLNYFRQLGIFYL